jgi:NADP-dependent 3-hydroxy acid dehydrogenase YdfG
VGNTAARYLAEKGYVVFAGVRKEKDAQQLLSYKIPTLRPVIVDVCKGDTIDACCKQLTKILEDEKLELVALINNVSHHNPHIAVLTLP